MKRIKKKLTKMLNAMAFAEAGEHETALEYLKDNERSDATPRAEVSANDKKRNLKRNIEDHLVAATFAEAGEFAAALEALKRPGPTILMVLSSAGIQPESNSLTHAVNLAKRIGGAVEILVLSPLPDISGDAYSNASAGHELATKLSTGVRERGVPCTASVLMETSGRDLLNYVRKHKKVAALICGYKKGADKSAFELRLLKRLENIVQKLSIPLIKVLESRLTMVHP